MNYIENEGEGDLLNCHSQCSVVGQNGNDPCTCPEKPETEAEHSSSAEEESIAGEDEVEIENSCGCPCQENRFFLSFQDTTNLGDICLDESRVKCKAFWEFVDNNERYKNLVKEGHYPKPLPLKPCYTACNDVCPEDTTDKYKTLTKIKTSKSGGQSAVRLPIEIKFRSDSERQRFQNRRNAITELQIKSGQPIIHAKPQELPLNFRNVFADEVKEINPLEFLK